MMTIMMKMTMTTMVTMLKFTEESIVKRVYCNHLTTMVTTIDEESDDNGDDQVLVGPHHLSLVK